MYSGYREHRSLRGELKVLFWIWIRRPSEGTHKGCPCGGIAAGWRIWGRGWSRRSEGYVGVGVAGGEGVVVGEGHVFGAVGAEGGLVVAADDGEGVEDVGGVVF